MNHVSWCAGGLAVVMWDGRVRGRGSGVDGGKRTLGTTIRVNRPYQHQFTRRMAHVPEDVEDVEVEGAHSRYGCCAATQKRSSLSIGRC
jgi:hypothetical protein